MTRSLTLAVVGADFPNKRGPGRRFEIALCAPGDPIELRPEPKNPVDPRAVAIYSERGVQLGYVSGERCQWIISMLARGVEITAIFQERTERGALIRVGLDCIPTLPAPRPPPEPHDDFPPDPIWDDD